VSRNTVRTLAIAFLIIQGAGVLVWWVALLLNPAARAPFMAPDAPDSTLLAFLPADVLIYAGGSLLTAYALARNKPWAWPALCIVTGATVYAALYGLALPLASGGGWLAAAFMLPSLIIMPLLVWLLRPGGAI
jgi:hypothetical protein